ncbi:MAG TPA: glycosyltransferase family 9 protein [Candidatus Methylacidiphilales bacterium]|nr:glycosyltransferase family 9 protein [Candidatus Methylacidiphilales bacterium]
MSLLRPILDLAAGSFRSGNSRRPEKNPTKPSILVIRQHRLDDMICTLPLLHALRNHFPTAHLAVACDMASAPIARAAASVDEVIMLSPGWNRWVTLPRHAERLQGHDWVLAAKGGFDRRLALLTRLTNGAVRIGFESSPAAGGDYFTHPVALPLQPHAEHQIETLLRLVAPLGIPPPVFDPAMLRLTLPGMVQDWAGHVFAQPPFAEAEFFALINLSCDRPVKFARADYAMLIRRLVEETSLATGIVGVRQDWAEAQALANEFPADRVAAIATGDVLDWAALLERCSIFITPEGGAAHLSSATQTPTIVLWAGHYGKWRPRGDRHVLVEARTGEPVIPVERIWRALPASLR